MSAPSPSIELHCHLDGCVRPQTIADLAREQGLELGGPIEELSRVSPSCRSLVQYISAIDVALDVLQTPDALHRAARELVHQWSQDNVVHGEARFAPQLHTRRGLALSEIVDAVADGLSTGAEETGVSASLILCCMRPGTSAATWEVVQVAALHPSVIGIDVAGPEKGVPLRPHVEAFRAGKEQGLRVTVHAGEADGSHNVWEAIDEMGAERIGHGVRSIDDAALVRRLATDAIAVELCPTSNLQTQAVGAIASHPINEFRSAGVPVTVSTDARTVSDVTLGSEFELLRQEFGWASPDWAAAQATALNAAFMSPKQRAGTRLEAG